METIETAEKREIPAWDDNWDLQAKIVEILGKKGPMTRADLCVELGLTEVIMWTAPHTQKATYNSETKRYTYSPAKQYPVNAKRTTVYDSLAKLMARNVVDKRPINNERRGRPKVLFQLKGGVISS